VRDNPSDVRRRRTGLRAATLLACVVLALAVGVITSALIREPAPANVAPIDLPAATGAATATPTPTPAGGFEPPSSDDDPEDDPFDDDD
jgi:hypothetical protein